MQKEELKFAESTVFEGMTSIRAILKSNELNINDRKIETILYDKSKFKKISKYIGYLRAVSVSNGYNVEETDSETIDKLTTGTSHGGIIAICKERSFPALSSIKIKERGFYASIQGIEDPYNFGYSIRSLYACGCDGIIIGERSWMSAAGVVCRSSAGASELIPVYRSDDDADAVRFFKDKGYTTVCADENTKNILGDVELPCPLFLIIGGEKRGISKNVLEMADIKVKIPYARAFNASLSAASATTMFAYEIMRQNH